MSFKLRIDTGEGTGAGSRTVPSSTTSHSGQRKTKSTRGKSSKAGGKGFDFGGSEETTSSDQGASVAEVDFPGLKHHIFEDLQRKRQPSEPLDPVDIKALPTALPSWVVQRGEYARVVESLLPQHFPAWNQGPADRTEADIRKIMSWIVQVPFFSVFAVPLLKSFAAAMRFRVIKVGDGPVSLPHPGDSGLYIVFAGHGTVECADQRYELCPGDVCGDLSWLSCPWARGPITSTSAEIHFLYLSQSEFDASLALHESLMTSLTMRFLRSLPLLKRWGRSRLLRLIDVLRPTVFPQGSTLFEQGRDADCIMLLDLGRCSVSKVGEVVHVRKWPVGLKEWRESKWVEKKRIDLGTITAPFLFGEADLLRGELRSVTVKAETTCLVYVLERRYLLYLAYEGTLERMRYNVDHSDRNPQHDIGARVNGRDRSMFADLTRTLSRAVDAEDGHDRLRFVPASTAEAEGSKVNSGTNSTHHDGEVREEKVPDTPDPERESQVVTDIDEILSGLAENLESDTALSPDSSPEDHLFSSQSFPALATVREDEDQEEAKKEQKEKMRKQVSFGPVRGALFGLRPFTPPSETQKGDCLYTEVEAVPEASQAPFSPIRRAKSEKWGSSGSLSSVVSRAMRKFKSIQNFKSTRASTRASLQAEAVRGSVATKKHLRPPSVERSIFEPHAVQGKFNTLPSPLIAAGRAHF